MERRPEPELMDLAHEVQAYVDADFSEVNARFVASAVELAAANRAVRVLDIGCGPGDIPLAIAAVRTGWTITAVDGSMPMLEIARTRASQRRLDNIRFLQADAKSLDFSPARFDLILSNSLLHHLPEPAGLWRSIRRAAAEGAVLFLRDLARPQSPVVAQQIVADHAGNESAMLQEELYRSLLAAFTVDEVRDQVRAAGLFSISVTMSSDRHLDALGTIGSP